MNRPTNLSDGVPILTVLILLLCLSAVGSDHGPPCQPAGRLGHPALREVSGIVRSRRHPGIYWVHNDSGNPAELHAVRPDGSLVRTFRLKVANVDWEDIAIDDQGHLYIGDIGNNDERLPIRVIYRLDEPDPSRNPTEPLTVPLATYYRFPRGQRFDAEGLFVEQGRAILVAKRRDGQEAELYRVPLEPPAPLLRPALPEPIGSLPGFVEPATGADLSADGQRLAVVSLKQARVYQRDGEQGWRLAATVPTSGEGVEAIAWDGSDLLVAGEDRSLCRIPESVWRGPGRDRP